jgi:hypothetical protein
MSQGRTNGTGIAFERRRWRRVALVAGAILIGSVSSVPSASATLVGEVADTVGSTVESVDVTPKAAPSLPSAMPPAPPATPPAPVATPAAPQAPVKLQTEAAPTPSSSPSPSRSGGNVLPSVDGIASVARNSVGSVTSIGKETTQQVAASARNDGSRVSTPSNAPDAGARGPDAGASKATPRATGIASSAPPSITAAEVAALQRWFARVWPAIPLGGGAGRGGAARVIGDLFRPVVAAAARLLFLAPLAARAASDPPYAGHPQTANAPQLALPNAPAPADGKRIIYRIALAALLALLAFTIWREFRSVRRPGVRW